MQHRWLINFLSLLSFLFILVGALPIESEHVHLEARIPISPSGLKFSANPKLWPNAATLRRILSGTKPNASVFWTGTVGLGTESMERTALEIAKRKGGNTLEGALASGGAVMPDITTRTNEAVRLWNQASDIFAESARGKTFVVMGTKINNNNTFHRTELPTLKRNRVVDEVRKISGLTRLEDPKPIFTRNNAKTTSVAAQAAQRQQACGAQPPAITKPGGTIKRRSLVERQVPPARSQRRKTAAAPACPLPGAKQTKKVVPRSSTAPKGFPTKAYPATKPLAKAPAPKRKVARPANRPKRVKGKAAPPRKRSTPAKKPKKAVKPATRPRGKPRRRR